MMLAAGMGYPRGLLQLLLVLTFTAVGTQAHCGSEEISQMRPCVSPHMRKLLPLINAFCDRDLITQDLCNVFKQIKDCASRKDIAECVEYNVFEELSQSGKGYSCGLMDFQDKCGNATMSKTKTATIRKARASKETEDETEDTEETATGRKAIPSKETATGRKAKPSKETATGRNAKPSNETATGRKAKPSKETATGRNAKPSKETADETEDSEETANARKAKPSKETADETEDSEETADETEDSEETANARKAKPSKETATGRKAKPSKGAASTSRASLVPVLVFTICLLLMSM